MQEEFNPCITEKCPTLEPHLQLAAIAKCKAKKSATVEITMLSRKTSADLIARSPNVEMESLILVRSVMRDQEILQEVFAALNANLSQLVHLLHAWEPHVVSKHQQPSAHALPKK